MTATTDWNAKTIAVLAPCSSKPSGVELRGLEPLAPSWRTRAMAVRQASLSMDLGAQRRESPGGRQWRRRTKLLGRRGPVSPCQ